MDLAPAVLVAPVVLVDRLVPVHVRVVVPVDRVDLVGPPAAAVEVPAVLVAPAVPVVPVVREVPVDLAAVRVVREDAEASATAPVAAAIPQAHSVSPGGAPREAVSPSAPSAKSSTTWKRRRSVAFGCRVEAVRPCDCRAVPH